MEQLTGNKKYLNRWTHLDNQYASWKPLYKDITDFILPRRGNYLDRGKPDQSTQINRSDNIIIETATRANRILGAGMQGGLCSPSRPWFRLTLLDEELANWGPVKEWLNVVEKILYKVYAGSNFYTEIHTIFEEQGGFGTGLLLQEEHFKNVVHFIRFSTGEYRLANGEDGQVDTVYRQRWLTAHQMEQMFGKGRMSDDAKKALLSNPYEWFECIHVIEPRKNRNVTKQDRWNMPYKSRWFQKDVDEKVLRESGYQEKPFVAPRWTKVGQSPYGLGPGADVLGNVKMLQEMAKTAIKGMHKEVDPPMSIPSQYKDVISLLPGASNWRDKDDTSKIEPLYEVRINLQNLMHFIGDIREEIGRTYYTDLFLLITGAEQSGREMTATEILQRQQEKLLMLGPTIERQIHELLDPVIDRTFNIGMRNGLFPPPPEDAQGQELRVEYVSILAQAQKLADASSMQAYLTEVERIALLDPNSAMAKTNFFEYLQQFGNVVGLPANIVNTEEEAEAKLQALLEKERQLQQMEQMRAGAEAVGKLGQASTEEGTALGDLKRQMEA